MTKLEYALWHLQAFWFEWLVFGVMAAIAVLMALVVIGGSRKSPIPAPRALPSYPPNGMYSYRLVMVTKPKPKRRRRRRKGTK